MAEAKKKKEKMIKYQFEGREQIKRIAKKSGNSSHIYVPAGWENKECIIIRVD